LPNILLIHSDQHRYDCLGVTGHPLVQTPHLDRMAADGALFTHAFTPTPNCSPARNSLLTGQWSFQHGVITAAEGDEASRGPRPDAVTFSRLLAEQGWYLGYVGKWRVDAVRLPTDRQFGFHDFVPEEAYADWRRDAGIAPAFEWPTGEQRPTSERILDFFAGRVDPHVEPERSRLAWGADHVISLLERRPRDRPFCLRWDPSGPHLPNVVPEPYASLYSPAEIEPWPGFDDPLIGKPYIQAQQRRTWAVEDWTWSDWSRVVGRYLGEISLLDAQIGRILAALEDSGAADDTLVVYTADHGDLCGSHGMWDKHYVLYDDVVRVPLIARWPSRITAGTVHSGFVSHELDLASSFLSVAGIEPPDSFAGTSLIDQLASSALTREDIITVDHGPAQFGLYSQRMLRERRWKYIWNLTGEDELYDLEHDPGELHNLARDPTARPELDRLRLRLLQWLRQIADPLTSWAGPVQLEEGRKL
jgi:arylsulfatase A-like enzyme